MFEHLRLGDRSNRGSRSPTPSPRSSSSDDRPNTPKPDKYLLRVSAGPSYDLSTHKLVHVNGPDELAIENEFMSVKLKVRIRGYNGLPRSSPSVSPYFSHPLHKNDQYSIAFTFVPRVTIPATDIIWGNDFDHPIRDRLPPGFNTALKIVKQWIDPGLEADAYADKPWMHGPALSTWFAFRVGDKVAENSSIYQNGTSSPVPTVVAERKDEASDIIEEGADGSGKEVRRLKGIPDAPEKRRKFFLDEQHRKNFEFEQGRVYQVDFFNPYLDFSNFALKLPGFSLGVLKYIGDKTHTLRYVFKNRKTEEVFFVLELKLLFGDELNDAILDGEQAEGQQQHGIETTPDDVD